MSDPTTSRDPFARAYSGLRGELARASRPPGSRIRVDETARSLAISPTPVREALARLTGERLVHGCRRQGFFVPRYSASDLDQLYQLAEMHLLAAVRASATAAERSSSGAAPPAPKAAPHETCHMARVLITILVRSGCAMLLDVGALAIERLAIAREAERDVIGDPDVECRQIELMLEEGNYRTLRKALEAYHRARRQRCEPIAAAMAKLAVTRTEYIPDIV